MTKPLEGIRVIELARILAGPWAGQILADLGAEVIKIESPAGDDTRSWGPPFIGEGDDRTAAYYYACNRGKKSVVIDFKTPEGLSDLKALIESADVLVENFKFGGLAKYGLDYDSLKDANPGLIYASITGFGHSGPDAHKAGYDFLTQGIAGLMSITGEPHEPPQKIGIALTDIITGLYAIIGIQAALRTREQTGLGQHIDTALLDSAVAITSNQAMNYLASGVAPKRMGNDHPNIVPYRVFEVSDGFIILAVGNDGQFHRLCDILGKPDLADDPRYNTNEARVDHRQELVPILIDLIKPWTMADLLQECGEHAVPAAPINDMDAVFDYPQVVARGLQVERRGVPGVRLPILMSDSELVSEMPAPDLGEHTEEVLSALHKERA
ncbi:MAG: CaiB/BaiF CoA-transferase family protein [Pseudomonadota bacterium]